MRISISYIYTMFCKHLLLLNWHYIIIDNPVWFFSATFSVYLSVFFSHFLRVSVCPDDRRGRVSSGGHLSQTKMGPKIQNPKGQKSYGLVFYHTFFFVMRKTFADLEGVSEVQTPLQDSKFFKHLELPKICLRPRPLANSNNCRTHPSPFFLSAHA